MLVENCYEKPPQSLSRSTEALFTTAAFTHKKSERDCLYVALDVDVILI